MLFFLLVLVVASFQSNTPQVTQPTLETAPAALPAYQAPTTPDPTYPQAASPQEQVQVTDLCYDYRTQQRLDSLVRVVAKKNMMLAQQIHGRTLGCTFYPDVSIARFDVTINWESMGGGTPYWLNGTMELGESTWEWKPGTASATLTEVNRNWSEAKFWGAVILGVGAAAVIAKSQSDKKAAAQKSGYAAVCFWNETPYELSLETRWPDESVWTPARVLPGKGMSSYSGSSDTFFVRMDAALDESVDTRIFSLPARRPTATAQFECKDVWNYELFAQGNIVQIR